MFLEAEGGSGLTEILRDLPLLIVMDVHIRNLSKLL